MRHQVSKKQFGRHTSHRQAMFRNMVTSLIEEERITTTTVKAKELRKLAERMVTLAKDGSLHARRRAAAVLRNKRALSKLFSEIGPRFKDRPGGYTRILKLGHRLGDGADMAFIEYLGYQPKQVKQQAADSESKKETKKK